MVCPGKVLCDGKFTKGTGCPSIPRPPPWFSDLGPEERKGKSQPCRGSSTQSDSRLLQLNSQKDGLCWSSCRKPSLGLGAGNHVSSVPGKPSCSEHGSLLQLSHFWWAAHGESSKQRPTPGNTPRGKPRGFCGFPPAKSHQAVQAIAASTENVLFWITAVP